VVTCGSIEERPLRDLAGFVDAAHVDLKGFDDGIYRRLNAGKLDAILRTLRIYRELGVWFEIINLIVPTYTDDLDMIRRMCEWIVANLGPDQPLHFSRFFPQHELDHLEPTPVDILVAARDAARASGLRYVYVGNVRGVPDAGTTCCPNCHRAVIERDIFAVTRFALEHGKCPFCQTPIPGVWT
jgi:pyruvate formate lyase activating enzyme